MRRMQWFVANRTQVVVRQRLARHAASGLASARRRNIVLFASKGALQYLVQLFVCITLQASLFYRSVEALHFA